MKRTAKSEFPRFDTDLIIPESTDAFAVWEDSSWHNDACPSASVTFRGDDSPEMRIVLWQDCVDPQRRDADSFGKRLVITAYADDLPIDFCVDGETVEELRSALLNVLENSGGVAFNDDARPLGDLIVDTVMAWRAQGGEQGEKSGTLGESISWEWRTLLDDEINALPVNCKVAQDCIATMRAADAMIAVAADVADDIRTAAVQQCDIFWRG